jgi:hypothetical protein
MRRQMLFVGLALIALVGFASVGHARVDVNVGINLPGPPSLTIIPQTPVAYAPAVPANLFFYGGQYYVFTNNAWYAGPTYNGPWAGVAPAYIPGPILAVPVRYYHAPPPAWKHWKRAAPPRWDATWGHEWKKAHKEEDKAYRKAVKQEEKVDKKERKEFEKEARKDKHHQ